MLEGKRVNLKIIEKEDLDLLAEWLNNPVFSGEFQDFPTQVSRFMLEKQIFEPKIPEMEWVHFIVQKKDGTKIGWAAHYVCSQNFGWIEIGYAIIPNERGKGYATEAIQILADYLFLAKDIGRIQAVTNPENKASKKSLEKAEFKREGRLRKALWVRGKWVDGYLYSIIREDWNEPKILTQKKSV